MTMWMKWPLQAEAGEESSAGGPADESASVVDWAAIDADLDATDDDFAEDLSSPSVESSVGSVPAVPAAPATAQTPPVTPGTPTSPSQSPNVPATPAAVPPVAQTPAGPTGTTTPTQQAPAPTSAPGPSDEDLSRQRNEFRSNLVKRYQLSEEQADLALTDPGKILPEIAADIQLGVAETVTHGIMQALPMILPQLIMQMQNEQRSESEFFSQFPELNDETGRQAVIHLGQAFRQTNKTATKEEFIQKVGLAALVTLGRHEGRQAQGAFPNNAPAVPTPPPPPASPGGATPLPRRQAPTNPFEILAEDFLSDGD